MGNRSWHCPVFLKTPFTRISCNVNPGNAPNIFKSPGIHQSQDCNCEFSFGVGACWNYDSRTYKWGATCEFRLRTSAADGRGDSTNRKGLNTYKYCGPRFLVQSAIGYVKSQASSAHQNDMSKHSGLHLILAACLEIWGSDV